jgi:hypothetical protein
MKSIEDLGDVERNLLNKEFEKYRLEFVAHVADEFNVNYVKMIDIQSLSLKVVKLVTGEELICGISITSATERPMTNYLIVLRPIVIIDNPTEDTISVQRWMKYGSNSVFFIHANCIASTSILLTSFVPVYLKQSPMIYDGNLMSEEDYEEYFRQSEKAAEQQEDSVEDNQKPIKSKKGSKDSSANVVSLSSYDAAKKHLH